MHTWHFEPSGDTGDNRPYDLPERMDLDGPTARERHRAREVREHARLRGAVELLRSDAPFVVDTSAWWRFSALSGDLAGLVRAAGDDCRMWITPIVRMEILYFASSSTEYIELEIDLDALRILRSDRAVTAAAMSAIGELAQRSRIPPRTDHGCAHRRGCRRARGCRGAQP